MSGNGKHGRHFTSTLSLAHASAHSSRRALALNAGAGHVLAASFSTHIPDVLGSGIGQETSGSAVPDTIAIEPCASHAQRAAALKTRGSDLVDNCVIKNLARSALSGGQAIVGPVEASCGVLLRDTNLLDDCFWLQREWGPRYTCVRQPRPSGKYQWGQSAVCLSVSDLGL